MNMPIHYGTSDLSLEGICILVAEDSEDALFFLKQFLTRHRGDVITAPNGKSGLELFRQHHPDIVITDLGMPLMNGLEMSQAIRELDSDAPIIILTGHSDASFLQQSIALQVAQYIVKPASLDKLTAALIPAVNKIHDRRKLNQTLTQLTNTVDQYQNQEQRLQQYVQNIIGDDQHIAVNVVRQSKESISGDFYGIRQVDCSLYIMLGDGMGHGLSAILPALTLPQRFRKLVEKGFGLNRIASEMNQLLYEQNLSGHFVAMTLIKLDANQQQIEVINCGNPPALLTDLAGTVLQNFSSNHFALGIAQSDEFAPDIQIHRYQDNAKLYLFSDGLPETLERLNRQPGLNLITEILRKQTLEEIGYWINTLPVEQQHDDITLLEIHIPPKPVPKRSAPSPTLQARFTPYKTNLTDLSVLCVDDDPIGLEFLTSFLARRAGAVFSAQNGKEGLLAFEQHRPRLVIAEVEMPVMNCLHMIEAIRTIDPYVMVILTSGDPTWLRTPERHGALLEFPASKFLSKPLNQTKLLKTIEHCLQEYDVINGLRLSATILMNSPLAILVTDAEHNIIAVNPAFSTITGYSREDVLGCNPRILSSGNHDAQFYRQMWKHIEENGQWSGEIWNRRKSGEIYLEWVNIIAIKDSADQVLHYAATFSDITQRAHNEEKFRYMAHHDALTSLPNRVLFFDRLNHALLQAQREQTKVALIYLDIDHFKNINDTLGHSVGDELICAVAGALTTAVRDSDTISRLGGDEFALLLPGLASTDMAAGLVMKVFNAVSRDYQINGKELRISVSMGVTVYPGDGDDAETLIKRADNAMYQAKKRGRAGYQFFSFALERRVERHMLIQQSLHKALEHGEFELHYQPKYATDRQMIVGAEALLRWQNPELGRIAPSEFIPIAEESDVIIEISNWVLGQACQDLADWQQMGIDVVPIAINISPVHFHRSNLSQSLHHHLCHHDLSPALLQIELTEGVVMNHKQQTLNQLLAIKALGIAISIDDFGTGYSSLSYLRQLPIDELKIDRSFIMEITDEASLSNSRLTAIPSAIIELARKLEISLVAEGVETAVQRDFLQQNGCSVYQGYLFSKPVAKDTLTALLTQNRSSITWA